MSTPSTADIDLIQRIIPHRYPFLLIDKVVDIVEGKSAVGVKNVTFNEPQFQGHYPGAPIFPGVMVVEAMAQSAAVLVGASTNMVDKDLLIYFMGIDDCRFRRKVVPGDILHLSVVAVRGRIGSKVWKFKCTGTVDGEVAAEAQLTAMMDVAKP